MTDKVPIRTYQIINVINNKFGDIRTVVYDQTVFSDGSVTTTQNAKPLGGVSIEEIGVDYSDYYLKESIPQGNNVLNIFFPKIPHVEEKVEDLTDVFSSMSINPYKKELTGPSFVDNGQVVIKEPHVAKPTALVPVSATTETTDSEDEYPLCPICQKDILEADNEDNFLCSGCGGYFDNDFDQDEIREIALSKGVKLQPLAEDQDSDQE